MSEKLPDILFLFVLGTYLVFKITRISGHVMPTFLGRGEGFSNTTQQGNNYWTQAGL